MTEPQGTIRFDSFEVDTRTGEVRKNGVRIKLADQPFRVLVALLERPGELVGRDELQHLLWQGEVSGDFEQGLNRAVNRVRQVIRDSASRPKYIETLPGRGYRFVGEVKRPVRLTPAAPAQAPAARHRVPWWIGVGAAAAVAIALLVWRAWPEPIPALHVRRLTTDNYNKIPPVLSDGTRMYFLAGRTGEQFIVQIPAKGGQAVRLPITLPGPSCNLQDISPDGQEILLTAGPFVLRKSALPLWILQIGDGTARRVGSLPVTSATYGPNGALAFTTETELWVAPRTGPSRRLAELRDSVLGNVSWNPRGETIRFARQNPLTSTSSAWEIREDGTGLRAVRPAWSGVSNVPAGWTADGRLEIFAAEGGFWFAARPFFLAANRDSLPQKATEDDTEFSDRIRMRNSVSFPAIGIDRLGELQHYDEASGEWSPILEGISAEAAEYSRDGRRVVYVSYPQRTLWVRDADGKGPIQLTSPPMLASYPHWSPDGRQIAFNGQQSPNEPTKIFLVDAEGGAIRPAPKDAGSQGDPTWSPDGKKLLYGLYGRSIRESVYIRMADLESGAVTKFPGSDGLFGPRWSPDGKFVMALEWEGRRRLMLYRFATKQWAPITEDRSDFPTWSWDSKSILYRATDTLVRLQLEPPASKALAPLKAGDTGGFLHAIGIAADGSATRTLNRDSRQVYELSLQTR